jgi:CHAT domain-containing protein/Tfp pilus assembly protein PilF
MAAGPVAKLTREERKQLERRAAELNQQVNQLYQQGQYSAATKRLKLLWQTIERLYPKDQYPQGHAELAHCLNYQGFILQNERKYAQAWSYYEKALAMRERLYPKQRYPLGHPDLAQSLNNLGFVLNAQRKYAKALGYFKNALAMRERLYPKEQYPAGNIFLAESLNNLGSLLAAQGEYTQARSYFQKALAMHERLFPKERYPQGHPDLASCLNNLAGLLHAQGEYARARSYCQKALAMSESLYPVEKYPRGHPDLAQSLNNLGGLLGAQGEYVQARTYYHKALVMRERLYPKEEYPQGHPHLANSLNNLGVQLKAQGEYAQARTYYHKALEMYERLYPKEKYPRGHPNLARSISNLGRLLEVQGKYAQARRYLQKAVEMNECLYPKEKYPWGHPDLALSLNNLGTLLLAHGVYDQAQTYLKQALVMRERLYPKEQYPRGHPDLTQSLNRLGTLLHAQGEYDQARTYFQKALMMRERLYPKEQYPQGHPHLALSLSNLGANLQAQGKYGQALNYLKRGVEMYQGLTDLFMEASAEAEAFSLAASLPRTRDGLLSGSRHLPASEQSVYGLVWRGKAAITRLVASRQQALVHALLPGKMRPAERHEVQQTWQDLLDARRALSRLLLAPVSNAKDHRQRLQQLSQKKVDLEQKLAKLLPTFARQQDLERQSYDGLVKKLPHGAVFIDLLRYVRFDQDPKRKGEAGQRRTECYVAFVLAKGRPVKRVELERAAPIDQALAAWRSDIRQKKTGGPASQKLRLLLWRPLAKYLPARTKTLWLSPDAALTWLPWPALPVNQAGRVLLEDYQVGVVPHGPFLLEKLSGQPPSDRDTGLLLAVGGVQYEARPDIVQRPEELTMNRQPVLGKGSLTWDNLPGSRHELERVIVLAGQRAVHRLTGTQPSTTRLLAELPKARWVHLATHGFFADKKFRSILQIDEELFDRDRFHEGPPPGARNPLVLSGLVLAGANLPQPKDLKARTESDGGILTAEAIAGLPLHRLELAVLSACETGLGEVAGGEGVFGLQRAFHLAGARNVVASLWKVDDQATAALMGLFYDKLWRQKKPAIQALREAQLTLYHHPERIAALAKERGPNFDKVVRLPITPDQETKPSPKGKAATRLWAGFVLSGLGR